jgi:hypothetical protein
MSLDRRVAYFQPSEDLPDEGELNFPAWTGTLAEFYDAYKTPPSAMERIGKELAERGYATWGGTDVTSGWLLTESERLRRIGDVGKPTMN